LFYIFDFNSCNLHLMVDCDCPPTGLKKLACDMSNNWSDDLDGLMLGAKLGEFHFQETSFLFQSEPVLTSSFLIS
jgi:hypothetical protein